MSFLASLVVGLKGGQQGPPKILLPGTAETDLAHFSERHNTVILNDVQHITHCKPDA